MKGLKRKNLWCCTLLGLLGVGVSGTAQAGLAGFGNFQLNGNNNMSTAGYPYLTGANTLTLMDGVQGASGSAWAAEPQNFMDGFVVRFTYAGGFSSTNQHGIADGFTFALQNSGSGLEARGNDGGSLGFEGQGAYTVNNAVAIACQIAGGSHVGYAYNYGYATDRQDTGASGVRLDFSNKNQGQNNDPVAFTITYNPLIDAKALSVTAVQGTHTFTHTYSFPDTLLNILGGGWNLPWGMAYVGFTAGAGGDTSSQVISDFSFTQMSPPPKPLVAEPFDANANGFRVRIVAAGNAAPDTNTIVLTLDDQPVTPTSIVQDGLGTTLVGYQDAGLLLAPGSTHVGTIQFTGTGFSGAVAVTNTFTVPGYAVLTTAQQAPGPVNTALSGFAGRVHALPIARFPNSASLIGIERQLADGFVDPATSAPYVNQASVSGFTNEVINWSFYALYGQETGFFLSYNPVPQNWPDSPVPGLDDPSQGYGTNMAAEILTILELPAGSYQLGVSAADAFKLSFGSEPRDLLGAQVLSSVETSNRESTVAITVTNAGKYPVRLAWGDIKDDAQLEFYLVDFTTGNRVLINDRVAYPRVKAYSDTAALTRPYVRWVSPGPGEIANPDAPIIVKLEDGAAETVSSVSLQVNGSGTATTSKAGKQTTATLNHALLAAGASSTVTLVYSTSSGGRYTNTWSFAVPAYQVLPASLATPLNSGEMSKPGFRMKALALSTNVLMTTYGLAPGNLQNNDLDVWITAAQGLWAQNLNVADLSSFTDNGCYDLVGAVNYALGDKEGFFGSEARFPFLPNTEQGTDNCMFEALAYVQFPAPGYYEMGVNSDDGFEVSVGDSHGGASLLRVTAPAGLAKSYGAVPARGYSDTVLFPPVKARVIKANPIDLAGGDTTQVANADAFRGNIVLLQRGAAGNLALERAQELGAVGVIEMCDAGQWPTVQNPGVTIPAVRVWHNDGAALLAQCTAGNDSPVFALLGGGDQAQVLGAFKGGRGSQQPTVFGAWALQAGVYPLRLLYQNGGGGASIEWWSRDANGVRHLINDPNDPDALLAYRARAVASPMPQVKASALGSGVVLSWTGVGELQSAGSVEGPYYRAADQSNPQTNSLPLGQVFYRIRQY